MYVNLMSLKLFLICVCSAKDAKLYYNSHLKLLTFRKQQIVIRLVPHCMAFAKREYL